MKKLVLLLVVLVFLPLATSQSVGITPSSHDLGEVERGETYEIPLYLDADDELEVEFQAGTLTQERHMDDPGQVSYEDISEWINFREDAIETDPDDPVDIPEGGEATEQVDILLTIPRDAEPGVHHGYVLPEVVHEGGDGAGFGINPVSRFIFQFEVPGDVRHEFNVQDIDANRAAEDRVRVDIEVENTGTVTSLVSRSELEIIDDARRLDSFNTGSRAVAPGETETITYTWRESDEIQSGAYRVQGGVNYVTGSAFVDQSFSITDIITIEDVTGTDETTEGEEGEREDLPVWLIAMFLVLTGSIMYAMELDPLLIILALAALSASGVIWFSSLPVQAVGAVLITTVALFYYGWMQ